MRLRNPFRRIRIPRIRLWPLVLLLTIVVVGPPIAIATECAMKAAVDAPPIAVDPPSVRKAKSGVTGYAHGGASTYFTLPAWFIVYHAEEYAAAIGAARPSAFPYFSSIAQYWSYYRGVCDQTCSQYKFDFGSHLMLGAIGASFTIENGLKGAYENTVGRATERWSGTDTDEDRFAVQTAVEYGRFMHMRPWYDFSFKSKLSALWSQTHAWGPHPLRKWERRFALSVEYGAKAAFGWTIRQGAKAVYGGEDEWVYAWAERVPDTALRDPRVRSVTALGRGSHILALRRYEAFTGIVPQLVAAGVHFNDIAGNRRILVTAIGDPERTPPDDDKAHVLFAKALMGPSSQQRVAIDAQVGALGDVLKRLASSDATLERIYDY